MKRRLFLLIPLTVLFSFSLAQSNLEQGVLSCSAITDNAARLSCYDELANNPTEPEVTKGDNWYVSTDISPIDDSEAVFLSTYATEDSSVSPNAEDVRLVARCLEGDISAQIIWDEYLGLDTTEVTYRIGSSQAVTDTWYLSTRNSDTFYSLNEPANVDFINKLAVSDNGELIAQVTPYSENTRTAYFDVQGLNQHLDKLYGACE